MDDLLAKHAALSDPRIRLQNHEYRVTAPSGQSKGGRFYINGPLVIEKMDKASLGEPSYTKVATITKPGPGVCSDASMEQDRQRDLALWSLLASGGE